MFDPDKVVALLLAGGEGKRLQILSTERAKPAVPFGGMYRIIDFTLSNAMHSRIQRVGVLTQYRPSSLMDHLEIGESWDMVGRRRELKIMPPGVGHAPFDWYKGTADAVYQNTNYLTRNSPDLVLILSGDHIYHMDYRRLINFHLDNGADATLTTMRVPIEQCTRFGVVEVNENHLITAFEEKPAVPKSDLASLGIYCFNLDVLLMFLKLDAQDSHSSHDFGRDLLPKMIDELRFYSYTFDGYWRDVGTVHSYWDANMDVLRPDSGLDLQRWKVRTNLRYRWVGELPPMSVTTGGKAINSLISKGCVIEGEVRDSILGPGVRVLRKARVVDSIIMHDTTVGAGACVSYSIIDKDVIVGGNARIGDDRAEAHGDGALEGLTIIGKKASIPSGYTIGSNCMIPPKVAARQLPGKGMEDGARVMEQEV
ncbi:glucose-1-phosphate adenylyltransferase [bacterium]|nr:glucose-1-phosphate adenylyltransferase [candidate division CSSED10-310 bacterium]